MDPILSGEFDCAQVLTALSESEIASPTHILQIVCDCHATVGRALESQKVFEWLELVGGNNHCCQRRKVLPDLQWGQQGGGNVEVFGLMLKELEKRKGSWRASGCDYPASRLTSRENFQSLSGATRATW